MLDYYLDGPDLPEPEPEETDAEADERTLYAAVDLQLCHTCGFTVKECICDEDDVPREMWRGIQPV